MPELLHDLCSPSKLDLRYSCPGSARMEKELIGTGRSAVSEPASEGARKHDLVTAWRSKAGHPSDIDHDVAWTIEEVIRIISDYIEVPEVIVVDEYQIDLTDLGISGGKEGCRIDLLIVIPGRKAIIVDYKFGVMWVPRPKYNWQMKAYAVGAFRAFGVTEIEVIILQPNTDEEYQVKSDYFYAPEITAFEADIKEIVAKTKDPAAPLVRGGHCTYGFCKAKDTCPLWRNAYLELPVHTTVAAHLKNISPVQRKELYENILAAESWCKKARSVVELLAINNEIDVDGYEIGAGRKTRDWGKPDQDVRVALSTLAATMKRQIALYHPEQLKSPAEIEAELGKSKVVKETLKPLVIYKDGKPCLKKKAVEM
jgi:hypothetical protein